MWSYSLSYRFSLLNLLKLVILTSLKKYIYSFWLVGNYEEIVFKQIHDLYQLTWCSDYTICRLKQLCQYV